MLASRCMDVLCCSINLQCCSSRVLCHLHYFTLMLVACTSSFTPFYLLCSSPVHSTLYTPFYCTLMLVSYTLFTLFYSDICCKFFFIHAILRWCNVTCTVLCNSRHFTVIMLLVLCNSRHFTVIYVESSFSFTAIYSDICHVYFVIHAILRWCVATWWDVLLPVNCTVQ